MNPISQLTISAFFVLTAMISAILSQGENITNSPLSSTNSVATSSPTSSKLPKKLSLIVTENLSSSTSLRLPNSTLVTQSTFTDSDDVTSNQFLGSNITLSANMSTIATTDNIQYTNSTNITIMATDLSRPNNRVQGLSLKFNKDFIPAYENISSSSSRSLEIVVCKIIGLVAHITKCELKSIRNGSVIADVQVVSASDVAVISKDLMELCGKDNVKVPPMCQNSDLIVVIRNDSIVNICDDTSVTHCSTFSRCTGYHYNGNPIRDTCKCNAGFKNEFVNKFEGRICTELCKSQCQNAGECIEIFGGKVMCKCLSFSSGTFCESVFLPPWIIVLIVLAIVITVFLIVISIVFVIVSILHSHTSPSLSTLEANELNSQQEQEILELRRLRGQLENRNRQPGIPERSL